MKIPINNDFGDDCLVLAGKMSNFAGMDGLVIGLLIPLVGTVLGAGFVFFMRDTMPAWLQKVLLGFASGVMVAASVWSLLIPSMELSEDMGRMSVIPATAGFLLGMAILSVAAGAVILNNPFGAIETVVAVTGGCLIYESVADLVTTMLLNKKIKGIEKNIEQSKG